MKELLLELQAALEVANHKERKAEKEAKSYGSVALIVDYEKAQGFTNGLLEAIEIVRLYKDKK